MCLVFIWCCPRCRVPTSSNLKFMGHMGDAEVVCVRCDGWQFAWYFRWVSKVLHVSSLLYVNSAQLPPTWLKETAIISNCVTATQFQTNKTGFYYQSETGKCDLNYNGLIFATHSLWFVPISWVSGTAEPCEKCLVVNVSAPQLYNLASTNKNKEKHTHA